MLPCCLVQFFCFSRRRSCCRGSTTSPSSTSGVGTVAAPRCTSTLRPSTCSSSGRRHRMAVLGLKKWRALIYRWGLFMFIPFARAILFVQKATYAPWPAQSPFGTRWDEFLCHGPGIDVSCEGTLLELVLYPFQSQGTSKRGKRRNLGFPSLTHTLLVTKGTLCRPSHESLAL